MIFEEVSDSRQNTKFEDQKKLLVLLKLPLSWKITAFMNNVLVTDYDRTFFFMIQFSSDKVHLQDFLQYTKQECWIGNI